MINIQGDQPLIYLKSAVPWIILQLQLYVMFLHFFSSKPMRYLFKQAINHQFHCKLINFSFLPNLAMFGQF